MAVSLLSGSSDKCFLVSWCTLTVALSLSVLCLSVLVQHTLFLDLKVWIIPFDYIFTISRPPPLFLISLIFFHKSRNKYVNDIKCTSHCFNKLFTYWIKIEPILPTPHGILFFLAIHFVYFHLRTTSPAPLIQIRKSTFSYHWLDIWLHFWNLVHSLHQCKQMKPIHCK